MNNSIRTTVDPTDEPVTLSEMKDFLRVEHSDDDALIVSMIAAARELCEAKTARHFCTRTVVSYWDDWPADNCLEVPRPFDSTTATPTLKYYTEGSTSATTLASNTYWVDNENEPGRIVLRETQAWPSASLRSANGLELTYKTGYGAESDVPDGVMAAMRFLVGHWYANREAVLVGTISKKVEFGVDALLGPHKVPYVA